MKFRNFWLSKAKERNILKIIEWAQNNNILVEDLTQKDICTALKAMRQYTPGAADLDVGLHSAGIC